MNKDLVFLIIWLMFCGTIGGVILLVFHLDRLVVAFLCLINAPVYPEARRVATLVYQHPGQWKAYEHKLEHPKIGEIWCGLGCNRSLHVEGKAFGRWDPNYIERRIIYNAVSWYRRVYIKHLLTQVLNTPTLNVPLPAE
jgi:hypothetical protein